MQAETKEIVNAPIDVVYTLLRDEMEKIVLYIPNVEKIKRIEYERISDTEVKITNHWYARAEIPSAIKSFIKPELFQWKDYAHWKDDEKCVHFRVESLVANNLYELSGTNSFVPHGDDKTEIKVTFNLEMYPERLPGVPKFVGKRLKSTFEALINKLLTPNLTSMAKGLNEYIKAQG